MPRAAFPRKSTGPGGASPANSSDGPQHLADCNGSGRRRESAGCGMLRKGGPGAPRSAPRGERRRPARGRPDCGRLRGLRPRYESGSRARPPGGLSGVSRCRGRGVKVSTYGNGGDLLLGRNVHGEGDASRGLPTSHGRRHRRRINRVDSSGATRRLFAWTAARGRKGFSRRHHLPAARGRMAGDRIRSTFAIEVAPFASIASRHTPNRLREDEISAFGVPQRPTTAVRAPSGGFPIL